MSAAAAWPSPSRWAIRATTHEACRRRRAQVSSARSNSASRRSGPTSTTHGAPRTQSLTTSRSRSEPVACEVALARRLGESVEVLRAAISPGRLSAEGAPVGDQIEDRSIVAIEHGADTPAMAIALFARKTGLDAALEAAPDTGFGCRLLELPADQCVDAARRRAWSALALLIEPGREPEPVELAAPSELIRWLADPGDESAAAFLALLTRLRQSPQVFQREAT